MASDSVIVEAFDGASITKSMLEDAAALFSENYGIWGPLAGNISGGSLKQGHCVRMSASYLKTQLLPATQSGIRHVHIKARVNGTLVGHVFSTRWQHEGKQICWITQLVVAKNFRARGLATQMLQKLRAGKDHVFGILSSHPFAIAAASRALGRGLENLNLAMTRETGRSIMLSSPVKYVRIAKPAGSLFDGESDGSGAVSCADTGFFVDHKEPLDALGIIKAKGIEWPLGTLPDGHEFLVLFTNSKPSSAG